MIKQSGYPFRNYEVPKEACAKNVNYELAANKRGAANNICFGFYSIDHCKLRSPQKVVSKKVQGFGPEATPF